MKSFLKLSVVVLLFFSCENNNNPEVKEKVKLSIGFDKLSDTQGKLMEVPSPDAIIISIKDSEGEFVYNMEKFNLIKLGNEYLTNNIEFLAGTYTVEDFIVVDEKDSAIYLTPKQGSEFADMVSTPLPYQFEVKNSETNKVVLDVIDANIGNPEQYGYSVFSFNKVNTLDVGLIAYYPFTSNVRDSSGNGLDGTIIGALNYVSDRNGNASSAMEFPGYGKNYVKVPDNDLLDHEFDTGDAMSISTWFYATKNDNPAHVILSKGIEGSGTYNYNLSYCNDELLCFITTVSIEMDSCGSGLLSTRPTNNQWHHLVVTINATGENSGEKNMYLDGIKVNFCDNYFSKNNSNDDILTIGLMLNIDGSAKHHFKGIIDDIRIYNRELTYNEVLKLYNE